MPQVRQLAAIMFTDIVGYTALMGSDERKAFDALGKNRAIHKPSIEKHNGRWIKELGDGVMASFPTVSDAVNAALEIQQLCTSLNEFQLRIGIHLGEVIFEESDVFGDGVNIAARIQSAAEPGCIYISESVQGNVANKKDIRTRFVRTEQLKNVKEPVRIYEVLTMERTEENKPLPAQANKQPQEKSIAVLAFANMSSDPEQEYFSDGISEEIINMLAQVPGLKVAARTSSFSFKGKNQDLRFIGEQLNVNYILEGSVRKGGNKIRITAQLIKASDGYHLYSEKFDRELDDIFEVQDEIALAILNAIKIRLIESDKEDILKRYTNNTEAYQLYLQGRYQVNKYNGHQAFLDGIKYYEQALAIEPDYALPYTGIAYCYFELLLDYILPADICMPKIQHAIERAMEIDSNLAESHLARADMFFIDWDFTRAEPNFRKVLELNPNNPVGNAHYGFYLLFRGNDEEACRYANISRDLDPYSLQNNWEVAWIYIFAGQLEKGAEIAQSMIQMEDNFFGGHYIKGFILMGEGRYEEAYPYILKGYELYPAYTAGTRALAVLYWKMGQAEKCRELISKIHELSENQATCYVELGIVYAMTGNTDLATTYLQKAVDAREPGLLFAEDNFLILDPHAYVPTIRKVLEQVERIKLGV